MNTIYEQLLNSKFLRKDGKVNTAVIRRDWFPDSKENKLVLDSTNFLPINATYAERVHCIKNELTSIPKCKCGKDLKWRVIDYNKTCADAACFTSTDARIDGHEKISKSKIDASVLHLQLLFDNYKSNDYQLLTIDEIKLFIENNYNSIIKHGINRDYNLKHNKSLLCSVLKHTENIIPIILDKDKLELNQRLFLIKTDLHSIPFCEKCNTQLLYRNFIKGFNCGQKKCYLEKAQEIKLQNKIQSLKIILEKRNFNLKSDHSINQEKSLIHCNVCDKDFLYDLSDGKSKSVRCGNCHPQSMQEDSLFDFIKSVYDGEMIKSWKMPWTKNKNAYKELDVYLPDLKIAFEFDGIYWHSDKNDKNYHLDKTESCLQNGIKLFHVFSNEWIDPIKRSIWESMIKSILNKNETLFARKCNIVEVDKPSSFLIENHLQGNCNSSIAYGLEHDGQLVCLATFGKARYSKDVNYELLRFCNKIGVNVVGGFSRLLSHFRKNHVGSLVTYADRRISSGNVYEKNGFTLSHKSKPNYFYWKGVKWFSRQHFQKHKLEKLLEVFDPNLTELENMKLNKWHVIYDCGNLVYILK